MTNIVGVRFNPTGRVRYFDPGDMDLSPGDYVVADTESGPQEGHVVITPRQILYSELHDPLTPVLRKLNTTDR